MENIERLRKKHAFANNRLQGPHRDIDMEDLADELPALLDLVEEMASAIGHFLIGCHERDEIGPDSFKDFRAVNKKFNQWNEIKP